MTIVFQDKDESPKEQAEEVKENGVPEPQDAKTPETEAVNGDEKSNETTITEKPVENGEKIEETPESKKSKEKTKKKKWSFRSISFSRKDKSKPNREAEKNGEVKEVAEEVSHFKITFPQHVVRQRILKINLLARLFVLQQRSKSFLKTIGKSF